MHPTPLINMPSIEALSILNYMCIIQQFRTNEEVMFKDMDVSHEKMDRKVGVV